MDTYIVARSWMLLRAGALPLVLSTEHGARTLVGDQSGASLAVRLDTCHAQREGGGRASFLFFCFFPFLSFLFGWFSLFFSFFRFLFCFFLVFLRCMNTKFVFVYISNLYLYVYKVCIRVCKVCIHVCKVCIRCVFSSFYFIF